MILLGASGHLTWMSKESRIPVHWEEFWKDAAGNWTGRAFIILMGGDELTGDWITELKRRIKLIAALNDRPGSTGYELNVAGLDLPVELQAADLSDLPVKISRVRRYVQPPRSADAKPL